MKIKYLLPIVTLLISLNCFSQDDSPAKIYFEKALSSFQKGSARQALVGANQALEADSAYADAYWLLAEIYYSYGSFENMYKVYKAALRHTANTNPEGYFLIANVEIYLEKYEDAIIHAKEYIKLKPEGEYSNDARIIINEAEFIVNSINNPVPFEPVNMGSNINSEFDEYLPAITADEKTLIKTIKLPKNMNSYGMDGLQEDFYVSKKIGDNWGKSVDMGKQINTTSNEGAQSISADGKYLFFTACSRPDGKGGCDIYFSKKVNERWVRPMNLGEPINTENWESQPSISSDGRTLYFTSNRKDGYGGKDIWKSVIGDDGMFSEPINMGSNINTRKDEMSPFIHPDNQTLYFASNGFLGMGALDIFISRLDETGNWGIPKNLGYPINTAKSESSLIVNASGDKAYFASERKGGFGKLDLYEFDLYEDVRPVSVTYFKGKVFDAETKQPLKAKFELVDLETSEVIIEFSSSEKTGEFLVCLPTGKNYALSVDKDNYLFHSENFSLKEIKDKTKPYLLDVLMQPIKADKHIVLRNVFFETDSYALKDESKVELTKLVKFLKKYSKIKIELQGHTDNVGSKEHNQKLSDNRAKSVYNHLVNNGVSKERLVYKGYGAKFSIADNNSEEGRSQNRRTEFKIISLQ